MQNARRRGAQSSVFRRRLHGRSLRQQLEADAIPTSEAMVECLHAVLHASRPQSNRLQALHRAAVVGGKQELHPAHACTNREERSIPKHSLLTRSQSVLSRVLRFHQESRQLLRHNNSNREDGKSRIRGFTKSLTIFSLVDADVRRAFASQHSACIAVPVPVRFPHQENTARSCN